MNNEGMKLIISMRLNPWKTTHAFWGWFAQRWLEQSTNSTYALRVLSGDQIWGGLTTLTRWTPHIILLAMTIAPVGNTTWGFNRFIVGVWSMFTVELRILSDNGGCFTYVQCFLRPPFGYGVCRSGNSNQSQLCIYCSDFLIVWNRDLMQFGV